MNQESNSPEDRPSEREIAALEEILREIDLNEADNQTLRSLTRILVGGALVSWDELLVHVRAWEAEARTEPTDESAGAGLVSRGASARTRATYSRLPMEEESTELLRHALLGILFESQARWARRGKALMRFTGRTTEAVLGPLVRGMEKSPVARPAQSRFEALVRRGEQVARRWVARGQIEEAHSRRLVRTATRETFNTSMDELGHAPALQDLVRKQSAGLSQDVLDEVRKRTVTGDLIAENITRRLLRRSPRDTLYTAETDRPESDVESG